jgi:hypothetical protein
MIETFAALLFAHVLADFLLQSNAMAEGKARRDPGPFALHVVIVALTSAVVLGAITPSALLMVLVLTALHGLIDLAKTFARPGLTAFLLDQAAHLATLALAAAFWPGFWALFAVGAAPVEGEEGWLGSLWPGGDGDGGGAPSAIPSLWADGLWAGASALPAIFAAAAGLIIAVRAGGFAVALLMRPWADVSLDGLPGAGRAIGYLERGLVFLLILTGQAGGIGFLIAAKSVLRFGAVKDEARLSEYVIVGTLASFGWAILAAGATEWLLGALSPLGIPDLSP